MAMLDLAFPVLGDEIDSDHAYELYAALSRLIPSLHEAEIAIRVAPINGAYAGKRILKLDARRSHLRFRLPAEAIPQVLLLAGKSLSVGRHAIRLGVPNVSALVPSASVHAKIVTIKGFTEPAGFLEAVARQMDALAIRGKADIPTHQIGPHAGQPRRRIVRIKDKKVVGFPLVVAELTAEESIRLQESGLGGRGKMGCGFFVPVFPKG